MQIEGGDMVHGDVYWLEYVHSPPGNGESTNAHPSSAIAQTHTWQLKVMQDFYADDLQDLHDALGLNGHCTCAGNPSSAAQVTCDRMNVTECSLVST